MSGQTLAIAARRLNAVAAIRNPRLPALFFITDAVRLADPVPAVERLPRGTGVIFRHYGVPGRAELARRVAVVCRARGLPLFVAADPVLARAVGAQGVHWPEALLGRVRRRLQRPRLLFTAAAHGPVALRRAAQVGVDAALLSPVFSTGSGREKRPLGIVRFAGLVRRAGLPVYALGGIDSRTAPRLAGTGIAGVAAVAGLLG